MTWTKLGDDFNDDSRLLALSRSTRLLHVEGLVYCNRLLTDGAVPAAMLHRFTDCEDPVKGAEELVEAGLWEAGDDGWRIVDFLVEQRSAAEVSIVKERNRERQERFRRHRSGDHSQCSTPWCNAVTNGVSNATPSRPVPSRPARGGKGTGLGRTDAPDGAPPAYVPQEPRMVRCVCGAIVGLVVDRYGVERTQPHLVGGRPNPEYSETITCNPTRPTFTELEPEPGPRTVRCETSAAISDPDTSPQPR